MTDDKPLNTGRVLARHCPRLGHIIRFSYCMQAGMDQSGAGQPCHKIMDCWWETFDIQGFLQDTLSAAAYEALLHKDPGNRRAASLLDAIGRAVDNNGESEQ